MREKKKFEIAVHGCDDSTYIEYELTEEELSLIKDIASEIEGASTYGCMPVMDVNPKGEED